MPLQPDPRVSIVVASRNRREQLLDSIPRHLALPERPPVIVVDNASEDGSAEAVERAHPEVRVIRLDENLGGAGRNIGVRAAETPYVAFSDDDSWWLPGALSRAADLMDADPRLGLIQARILVGAEQREDSICAEMARSPLPVAEGQVGHPLLSFVACAVVVRRSAFLAAGGFPRRFGVGGEEEIIGWDLVSAGWLLSYVPEIVGHHCPPKVPGGRPERREIGIRNTLWTTWLRRPVGAATVRTTRELRRFPRDRVTARGLARAVGGLPWILRERRVSPPHVEEMRRMLEDQQLASESRRYVD